jgi:hypothetical protein
MITWRLPRSVSSLDQLDLDLRYVTVPVTFFFVQVRTLRTSDLPRPHVDFFWALPHPFCVYNTPQLKSKVLHSSFLLADRPPSNLSEQLEKQLTNRKFGTSSSCVLISAPYQYQPRYFVIFFPLSLLTPPYLATVSTIL